MAAPIYTQAQVEAMIATPKCVPYDAWQNRFDGRASTDDLRHRIKAHPANEADLTDFLIEICQRPSRAEISFTLFGKLLGYTDHPLCRYEIQLCRHTNPNWFPPHTIPPRALHKHVYNERAIREDWEWDKCAQLLNQPNRKLSLQQSTDRLTPIFIEEIHLEIHDHEVNRVLFDGGG